MDAQRARGVLDEVVRRPGRSVRGRLRRVRGNGLLVIQCGVAAGLSWWIATRLVHHHVPFFAPISAVIVLGVSAGHRLRRTVELIIGVALGILVGDLLVTLVGIGPVQLAVVVTLAMATALFVGSGGPLVTQSGSSAVLICTLYPPGNGVYYTRWFDALIGGAVGFGVHAVLLPVNPLSAIRRAVRPVITALGDGLTTVAGALAAGDPAAADDALATLRGTEPALGAFREVLAAAEETVAVSPIRWRARGQLALYATAARYLDPAIRNSRVLGRRARRALRSGEQAPPQLPDAVRALAGAVRCLHQELERGAEPEQARERVVEAVRLAATAYTAGVAFSGSVVVAQVYSVALDLLRASGLEEQDAHTVIRRTRRQAEAAARGAG